MTVQRPFTTQQFTSTPWNSAEDKARFANALARFVQGGFERKRLSQRLYRQLTMLYGHIAHFNIDGFYEQWFSSPVRRNLWVQHVLGFVAFGDPSVAWRDVEAIFARWLKGTTIPERVSREATDWVEATERAELARLAAKYGPREA